MKKLARLATLVGVWSVGWGSVGEVKADCASGYSYHYVQIDDALPPGVAFFDPPKLTNNGRVYGTAYSCPSSCTASIAVYHHGTMTLRQSGVAYTANESGVVGGSVFTDIDNPIEQAALFRGNTTELIPRLPGEDTSHVFRLTDSGIALVVSINNTAFTSTYYLYKNGQRTVLNLGSGSISFLDVNNGGTVGGTMGNTSSNPFRAFRFEPPSNKMTILDPLPTEPFSWGQRINDQDYVLGYSFVAGALERIGVWHKKQFQTYFVEGTPAVPTVSSKLLWNDNGLIVVTRTDRNDMSSYIIPSVGVRINLADVSDSLPVWTDMTDVNNRGDILGVGGPQYFNAEHVFLLERTGH